MSTLLVIFTWAAVFFLYFTPYLVARHRQKKNREAIGVLNSFLGWTVIGWIVALVWATAKDSDARAEGSLKQRPASATRFCPHCGAPRDEGPYCAGCGKPLPALTGMEINAK
jgi:Superinfection immunity protein